MYGYVLFIHDYVCLPDLAKLYKSNEKRPFCLPQSFATTYMGVWQPHIVVHYNFQQHNYLNTNGYKQGQKTKIPLDIPTSAT